MIEVREEYKKTFKKILLIEDRTIWAAAPRPLTGDDLVLTFDYGLMRDIRAAGFQAGVLDHVVEPSVMNKLDYAMYGFLTGWHIDSGGQEIFIHEDVPFGECFRQDVWNDISYLTRMTICMLAIKGISASSVEYSLKEPISRSLAGQFGFVEVPYPVRAGEEVVYMARMFEYMDKVIRPKGFLHESRKYLRFVQNIIYSLVDIVSGSRWDGRRAFFQLYFPVIPVVRLAIKEKSMGIFTEGFPGNFWEKLALFPLPAVIVGKRHETTAKRLLEKYEESAAASFMVEGVDLGGMLHERIRKRLVSRLPEYVATIESFSKFFSRHKLNVIVLIANIGMKANILRIWGRLHGVPSYLVINGFMSGDYYPEARNADWINSYSASIRHNYYKDAANVICLGDPRMDEYYVRAQSLIRSSGRLPRVIIGSSCSDPAHLNGYLCEEFEFLEGVLAACRRCRASGHKFNLVIKIRKNNYIDQYHAFCREFYQDQPIQIIDSVPMLDVLSEADLYITMYSQSHLEAAFLGVPSICFKNDDFVFDPPFDGKSELLTASTSDELYGYMERFFSGEPVGRELMEREVLEKYWGPLDGQNTRRNLDFILELARQQRTADKGQGACKTC